MNHRTKLARRCVLGLSLVAASASADVTEATDEDRRLLEAILAEDMIGFERAIEDGADVNATHGKWSDEWPMCAATQPNKEIFLKALLDRGADPDLAHPWNTSTGLPAVCSMVNGNLVAFDILIEAGADPHLFGSKFNQVSLYLTALELGNFDIGLRLLEIVRPSYQDMLHTKEMVERRTTLQGPETRALAAHVEARGIPVDLPPARQ